MSANLDDVEKVSVTLASDVIGKGLQPGQTTRRTGARTGSRWRSKICHIIFCVSGGSCLLCFSGFYAMNYYMPLVLGSIIVMLCDKVGARGERG